MSADDKVISFWKSLGFRTTHAVALAGAGYDSLEKLAQAPAAALKQIPNFGKLGRETVREILARDPPPASRIANFSDSELVMELLRRGYTVGGRK